MSGLGLLSQQRKKYFPGRPVEEQYTILVYMFTADYPLTLR